jgi:hypothetical protein
MTWILAVVKGGIAIATRRYFTPSLCCEAIVKAEAYYLSLKQEVDLQMKDERGNLIITVPVREVTNG